MQPKPITQNIDIHASFPSKINKIANFFARTQRGGFLFCSYEQTEVLSEIIKLVIERTKAKELEIREIRLSADDSKSFPFALEVKPDRKLDGVIISDLDKLIALEGDDIIRSFNLSRDTMLKSRIPFLFCLTPENISKFANQAQDLFLRRERGVIHFPEISNPPPIEILPHFFKLRHLMDPESIRLKVPLLESQLKEARKIKINPNQIADEIAVPLIGVYTKAHLLNEANQLFNSYKADIDLTQNTSAISTIGDLYLNLGDSSMALKLFSRLEELRKQKHDLMGLVETFFSLIGIYTMQSDWMSADKYYSECLKTLEQYEAPLLEDSFRVGILSLLRGWFFERQQYDAKALEYYSKARKILSKRGYYKDFVSSIDETIEELKKR